MDAAAVPAWRDRAGAVASSRWLEPAAIGVLAAVALALWLAYPVLPTFDSAWALLWGHQILSGHLPEFMAYRAPTEHPLWVALGTLCAALGSAGERAMTLVTVASLIALVDGVWRLGRATLGPLAALLAVVLLLSRFHFAFYAAFAFLDVPYLALLVWAAALEAERPRRGGLVWVLLVAAGLLRPDAWLYALAYAVWLAGPWPLDLRRLARYIPLVALPALLWGLLDLSVTGDPTFSFTFTTGNAEDLSRTVPAWKVPWTIVAGLDDVARLPVFVAGVAGAVLAWRRLARRQVAMPAAVLVGGVLSFGLTTLAGFGVVNRYLAFAALGLVLFGGWLVAELLLLLVRRARASPALAAGAGALLLAGVVWTGAHFHPAGATGELSYRTHVEASLRTVLHSRAVSSRCGPISVPDHKLVPLVALDLALDPEHVLARSDPVVRQESGVAIIVGGGHRLLYHAAYGPFGTTENDPHTINDPPRGFHFTAGGDYDFHLYVRCPPSA